MVPKTHSNYLTVDSFVPMPIGPEPPDEQKTPEVRRHGHAEFFNLLRFCRNEPMVRRGPVSIEAVIVEGDAAVVGLLRPSAERCLLALMQFADRPASVSVRLAAPIDVPEVFLADAGKPQEREWVARELLQSIVDDGAAVSGRISGGTALNINLAPYGFRIFELGG